MPLLCLLLVVLSVLHLAHVEGFRINTRVFSLARALVSALTFHLNWLEASRNAWLPACWTILWSLSIEEMFYLFFPLVSIVLLRRGRWGVWAWCALAAVFVAMGPFARTIWAHTDLQYENSYLAGMSNIAFGCLAAIVTDQWARRPNLGKKGLAFIGALGWTLLLLIALWPKGSWLGPALKVLGRSGTDDTLLSFATCLVMVSSVLRGTAGRPWSAPLRWLGQHSYEVYLWHEFAVVAGVALYARRFHGNTSRLVLFVFCCSIVLVSAALGFVLARWFSEPRNRRLRGAPLPAELPAR